MKVLIAPVGIYIGRVMKGIASLKPDLIYLCVQKPVKEAESEYKKNLYIKWMNTTKKLAEDIVQKIKVFYSEDKIKILELDIRTDDYLSIYKDLLQLILSFKLDTEVYIDTTSTTYPFRIACITLSIFLKNVQVIYTPAKRPLPPDEYNKIEIQDEGTEPIIIPSPKIDFTELQNGDLKNILVTINKRFNGTVPSVTDLLLEMGMQNNKGNMIKMSKLLNKLHRYGCLSTVKEGRVKKIKLTMIGSSISEVLKNI
jgi:hypothetical protein